MRNLLSLVWLRRMGSRAALVVLLQALFPVATRAAASGECVAFDPQAPAGLPPLAAFAGQTLPAPSTPPPTDAEISRLISALEPVRDEAGDIVGVKGLTAEGSLGIPRAEVVIGDVSALLMEIHARDLAAKVRADRTLPDQARRWTEAAILSMNACVERRFASRGGAAAHGQALAVVERYRKSLEVLLVAGKPGGQRPPLWHPESPEPERCPPVGPAKNPVGPLKNPVGPVKTK